MTDITLPLTDVQREYLRDVRAWSAWATGGADKPATDAKDEAPNNSTTPVVMDLWVQRNWLLRYIDALEARLGGRLVTT